MRSRISQFAIRMVVAIGIRKGKIYKRVVNSLNFIKLGRAYERRLTRNFLAVALLLEDVEHLLTVTARALDLDHLITGLMVTAHPSASV